MGRTRTLEKIVSTRGGMSFTELKNRSGLENGVLQYHIRKSRELSKEKGAVIHRKRCAECPLTQLCQEKCVFKLLESESTTEILQLKAAGLKNSEIAEELELHRSTVTYHVSKLEENSLLEKKSIRKLVEENIL